MAAGTIAGIQNPSRRVQPVKRRLQAAPGRSRGRTRRARRNDRLFERGLAHVEQVTRLIKLELRLADIPLARELNENPFAGIALLPL